MKRLSKLKILFLTLTVGSIILFFSFSVLHNVFYALGIVFEDLLLLKYWFEALDAVFFLISVLIAPILFVVGLVGTIVMLIRKV